MFDGVARRYDLTNTVLSVGQDRRWRRCDAGRAARRPGRAGARPGSGDRRSSTVEFAAAGAQGGGRDFSLGMLRAGAAPARCRWWPATRWRCRSPTGCFDAVTISFGLRNVADPDAALAELARVTRPGGRLVVCEFSTPTWRAVPHRLHRVPDAGAARGSPGRCPATRTPTSTWPSRSGRGRTSRRWRAGSPPPAGPTSAGGTSPAASSRCTGRSSPPRASGEARPGIASLSACHPALLPGACADPAPRADPDPARGAGLRSRNQPPGPAGRLGRPGYRGPGRRRRRGPDGIAGLDRADARISTFVVAARLPDRAAWDEALTEAVPHTPDLVVSAGFMKLVGPTFLTRFAGRYLNTHNALLPAFPGMHGAARRARLRGEGGRRDVLSSTPGWTPGRSSRRSRCRCRRRHRGHAARADQGGRAPAARRVRRPAGPRGLDRHRTERSRSHDRPSDRRRPIRRALVSACTTRPGWSNWPALDAAGVEIVSTGIDGRRDRDAGHPGDPGRAAHRLPGVPRRPGQDAAPGGARRAARRPAADRPRGAARRAGHRAVRPAGRATSTRSARPSPPAPRSTSASSRSTSAVRRWCGRRRRTTRTWRWWSTRRGYPAVIAALADGGFTLAQRRALAAAAFAAHRRPTTSRWRLGARGARRRPDGWPGLARSAHLGRAAALRYGENPHQAAALYSALAAGRAGAGRAAARQGDVLQQLRRRRRRLARRVRLRRPVRGDHQARQPVRHRGRRRTSPTRTAGRTPATRSPPSAGSSRSTGRSPSSWPSRSPRCSPRCRGAGLRRTAPWRCCTAQEEHPAAGDAGRRARRTRSSSGRSPAGCWCRPRTAWTPPGDDPASWKLAAGDAGRRRDPGRPGVRLAGLPRGEVQRDPAGRRRRHRRRRHGPGEPGRLGPARGRPGPGTGRRARSPPPTRSSRSPTGCRCCIDAGVRAVVQPGGSVRDEEVIAAAEAAGVTMYFTGARHFFH